ncbi:MAG: NAD(P)/FAD-dependent oxidoreductase [Clostridia bacterium]
MRAAIMGAGLSGLTCAYILEKYGYNFDIFEDRTCIGDRFVNGEIIMEILDRPVQDIFSLLSMEHGLYLKATNVINKIMINSPKETAEIEAFVGYITIRGRHEYSLEKQIAANLKKSIYFNSQKTIEDLLYDYDKLVLATGDGSYSEKLQNYTTHIRVNLKGATIEGSFDPHTVIAWLNNNFAPQGYAYLIPFNSREANVVIGYPNYEHNKKYDIDKLWTNFLNSFNFRFRVTDQFQITNYQIGISDKCKVGNILFTGNCFGTIMPFLGFGQNAAMLTGIYAGLDICDKGKYEKHLKTLRASYFDSLALRKKLEKMNNDDYDTLVRLLKSPIGKQIFTNKKFNFLKYAAKVSKMLDRYDKTPQL